MFLNASQGCFLVLARSALAIGLLQATSAFGQTDSPIDGIVTTDSGQPITHVDVTGSYSKAGFNREHTAKDENGSFHPDYPGAAIHFFHEGYEPQSSVVRPGVTNIRVKLASPSDDLVVPTCTRPAPDQKRIGTPGLQFLIPRKGVKISGGKWDEDYVSYVIKLKSSKAGLEFRFGLNAIGPFPFVPKFESILREGHPFV